jgi:hypothetical protein
MATHQPRFSSAIPRSCGPECCEAVEGLLGAKSGPEQMQQVGEQHTQLFDHLVGAGEQLGGTVRPSTFGGLENRRNDDIDGLERQKSA